MSIRSKGIEYGIRWGRPYLEKFAKDVEFGTRRFAQRASGGSGGGPYISPFGAGSAIAKAFPPEVLASIEQGFKKLIPPQKAELRKTMEEIKGLLMTQRFGRLIDFFSRMGVKIGIETTKIPKNWADIQPWDLFRLKGPHGDVVIRFDYRVLNELQKMEAKGKTKDFAKTFFKELQEALEKGTTAPATNASGLKMQGNSSIKIKTAPHSTFGNDRIDGIKLADDVFNINNIHRGSH